LRGRSSAAPPGITASIWSMRLPRAVRAFRAARSWEAARSGFGLVMPTKGIFGQRRVISDLVRRHRPAKICGRTPIRSVDLSGPQQGQHLRRWTYCLASRRTVFKQLEQFAGVLAGKLSSNRFVGDQWNELRIDLAASSKRRRPDEPLYGDAQSGMLSASTIAAPRSPNKSTQSPISPPPAKLLEKDPLTQLSVTQDFSQGSCWTSRLAEASDDRLGGVPGPCVATGIGRATGTCNGSIGASEMTNRSNLCGGGRLPPLRGSSAISPGATGLTDTFLAQRVEARGSLLASAMSGGRCLPEGYPPAGRVVLHNTRSRIPPRSPVMMDAMTRADLYSRESTKTLDLAKSASSPFLRDYYRRIAER
jgi:hypothetical protein